MRGAGLPVALANPAAIQQYQGLKHSDDTDDAYWLAEMARLNILPTGYLCEPGLRSTRDLLRRRMLLVRQRTGLIVSFKSLMARMLGYTLSCDRVKSMKPEDADEFFDREHDRTAARTQLELIGHQVRLIRQLERTVLKEVRDTANYRGVQSLPGVGAILGMTLALETGEIGRFSTAGEFASYCRTVQSRRLSNQKVKGRGNRKCGNKYLACALVEAVHGAVRLDPRSKKFFERKKSQCNTALATKALACKLAKAAWWIMARGKPYDPQRMWGN